MCKRDASLHHEVHCHASTNEIILLLEATLGLPVNLIITYRSQTLYLNNNIVNPINIFHEGYKYLTQKGLK